MKNYQSLFESIIKSIKTVHKSWYKYLPLDRKVIDNIIRLYLEYDLVPEPQYIFNAFIIPVDKVKLIVFGQDPYPNNEGIGYAFAIKENVKEPLSFRRLKAEFSKFGIELDRKLTVWQKAGIISQNIGLVTEKGKPGTFTDYFIRFHETWLRRYKKDYPGVKIAVFGNVAYNVIVKKVGLPINYKFQHPAVRGSWDVDLTPIAEIIKQNT